jgi:hypothetical protein
MRDGQITEESVNNMIRLFDRTFEILHKRNPQILQLHLQSLYIQCQQNDVLSRNGITYVVQITFRWLGIVNGRVVPVMPPIKVQPPCNMQLRRRHAVGDGGMYRCRAATMPSPPLLPGPQITRMRLPFWIGWSR